MNKDSKVQIPWARSDFWGNEQQYVVEALSSTWISGGPFVDRLESILAAYCGVRHVLTACNGTAAIHMAYLALGIKPGDEVVVPGFAFMAAANAALHFGANPVFAEVDSDTWCVSATEIEKCLSPKTKLIVPIHTYGNVCPMDEILALARSRNIPVVEDAAEAFASRYKNRLAGTMATIGTFSFHATKTVTTGEGGMVVTKNKELYDIMSLYRNHGMLRKRFYWHEIPGHNFRLTNIQAALGCAQLERLDRIVLERRRVHATYREHLANCPGLTLQQFPSDVEPVLWAIAVRLNARAYPQGRDTVMRQMLEAGVETRPGFYSASLMPHIYNCGKLPVCENLSQQVISLPTFPTLADEQIELICDRLESLRR